MASPGSPGPVPSGAAPAALVGIGGSAGALDGYERFFTAMPAGSGLAFIVVPHLDPAGAGVMPELLARCTPLPVLEIIDGQEVQADHVYVLPPGHTVVVMQGILLLTPDPQAYKPIDQFFQSLAADQGGRAVGVVLSGMGTDGSQGVQAIKEHLGLVLVQDPASAQYPSMPHSAVATGTADRVLPAEELAAELYAHVTRTRALRQQDAFPDSGRASAALQKILLHVRARTGQDFSPYKQSTLVRRIDRRMKSQQIQELGHYARYLGEHPAEVDALFRDFLINVTSFFRDPQAFEVLGTQLRAYLHEHADLDAFRVWVTGCSTGEEAYSLAILLTEVLDGFAGERHVQVQVFATDLDQEAIDVARLGVYSPQGVAGVSPARLERFFTPLPGGFQVRSELREMIVFARHNVFGDPPFTRLDLLSCRNLLIYFGAELQKQILPLFHYALKPGGLLFLGPSETLGPSRDLFGSVDNRWKLYRRGHDRGGGPPLGYLNSAPPAPERLSPPRPGRLRGESLAGQPKVPSMIQHLLVSEWAPPAVAVDAQGNVVYVSGRTGAYLELPVGMPNNNVVDMALPALRYELDSALGVAVSSGQEVRPPNLTVEVCGVPRSIELIVRPLHLPEHAQPLFLIVFQDRGAAADPGTARSVLPEYGERTAELERELATAREYLRATIEEMEVSLEERKSTNEELQTANEELQSSNEELMTSKEELQSLNEELITINSEHQVIITDLQQANDDMKNLLDSLGIATVFLGNDLRIKRFTPGITQVINLRPVDLGRPLTDLASNLRYGDLAGDIGRVLQTLTPLEVSVQTLEGRWFLMRISPYRTFDNVIDGVVVVFTDIAPLKRLEQDLREALLYSEAIVNTLSDPLLVLDHNLRVVTHNQALLGLLHLGSGDVQGERLYDLGDGQFDQPELVGRLRDLGLGTGSLSDFMLDMDLPGVGHRAIKFNARQLLGQDGTTTLLLLWGEDVTPILEQVAEAGAAAIHGEGPEV
ncbi:PAS:CheB methylesterase:MCP methyltransferase [Deinococcus phoenicis]|uniref:protein-glutamate O-methyltransferase n=1 Tax=Deinococcus phoenicis TaxID=1476583 RepID=A0A016QTR7_9DEIO|nr:CheR family methyltransferase [Deinococcus phoenicis]EYB69458.1 PAS:CheB methylesterase:MCP methyltransferase [Deinococcus phoenicis]